ncbi:hypothetical protein NDU88_009272 [Pleurodeles waltl]|uniref:Uncharacterized protein n=1 Tax=Pleurodeles waltl TaxID=8319 RepID=A0AAV7P2S3_PLEWA|nr:hypothetical protein NDU88_009272 [Pleurodeles waltl]
MMQTTLVTGEAEVIDPPEAVLCGGAPVRKNAASPEEGHLRELPGPSLEPGDTNWLALAVSVVIRTQMGRDLR